MRIKKSCEVHSAPNQIIGHFGQVRWGWKAAGKHELVGGETEAQATVRKWCGDYAPLVVFVEPFEHDVVLAA
ncbi:MAG TPA: hypothetical protein VG347_06045 [Verrucomicrobiae bacterium]|nr:hypothetical protein [Verrucomicrobiae bacterium]